MHEQPLPFTYQGMKDYVRAGEAQIKRNNKNTADLMEALATLRPRIAEIEKQQKEFENG